MNAHTQPQHDTTHGELHAEMAEAFDTTAMATETTLLNPRFYTTDFDEMDRIDVTPVRAEWDKLIAQMKSDPNKGHFKKNADWDEVDWAGMDPALTARLLASDADRDEVARRESHARQRGISSVPTFIVADAHAVSGAQPAELWQSVIDEIMAASR